MTTEAVELFDLDATPGMDAVAATASASGAVLPQHYYIDHFMQVIEGLRSRYGFLLSLEERRYLAVLDALSAPALMLHARLVNRHGPCFRLDRLDYPEIAPLDTAVTELLAAGLLEPCDESLDPKLRDRLFACFAHAELKARLQKHWPPKHGRKDELLAWLAAWDGCEAWLKDFLAAHPVVRIPEQCPWPFLRFLFFGELRDNLSDFVTNALGHIVAERIDGQLLVPQFASRVAVEDAYRMAMLYAEFRHIRETQPALVTLAWWQAQAVNRGALAAGAEWFDRLVDRLGRLLERGRHFDEACTLYQTSPAAPARERLARLLIKAGDGEAATALLRSMRDAPCHAEEAYAARQLLGRLEKTSRRSEARALQWDSHRLVLNYPQGAVEAAVLTHYRAQGWHGVHSENWLWNGSFGLLLWDIVYDASVGAFHSPLQFAPSDLHDPAFYARRQPAIDARLELLGDPDAALALIRRHFAEKHGIANPFVHWHDELLPVLEVMLRRLPPTGHAAALRHLARDIKRHARGLPDLFMWNDDGGYRFIEVKAENDHLAPHQYEWLRVLSQVGINVTLENVARSVKSRAAAEEAIARMSAFRMTVAGVPAVRMPGA